MYSLTLNKNFPSIVLIFFMGCSSETHVDVSFARPNRAVSFDSHVSLLVAKFYLTSNDYTRLVISTKTFTFDFGK